MKRLILKKIDSNPIVAHLYEHLYCLELTELFRSHALMRYVDYDYWGEQQDGIITFEVRLYSKEAERIVDDVAHLNPPFKQAPINTCINQLNAEHMAVLHSDFKRLVSALGHLHATPWGDMNRADVFDTKQAQLDLDWLWYSETPKQSFANLKCEFVLNYHPNVLGPLFNVVANALSDNIADMLMNSYGYYYAKSDDSNYELRKPRETAIFRAYTEAVPALNYEGDACKDDIAMMLKLGFVAKVAGYLQRATYSEPWQVPDETKIYKKTGLLLGAAGWREIGTEENIKKLLDATTLRLVYGRQEQTLALADVERH